MDRAPNSTSLSRALGKRFVLMAGLAVFVVGCTTVANHLTGVRPERLSPIGCVDNCKSLYASLVSQELKLREENLESCRILPQPDRGACLDEEGVRHAAEMDRLERLKAECLTNCVKSGVVPG